MLLGFLEFAVRFLADLTTPALTSRFGLEDSDRLEDSTRFADH